nr:unnamed protein product [Spirometra erinaceieuropaei]
MGSAANTIQSIRFPPYHPQSNDQEERFADISKKQWSLAVTAAYLRSFFLFSLYAMSFVYKALVKAGDRVVPTAFRPVWEHPAGPKTVFFWAPTFKWGLVIAGLADLTRPVEKRQFVCRGNRDLPALSHFQTSENLTDDFACGEHLTPMRALYWTAST